MELTQLQAATNQLKQDIRTLIDNFQNATGASVHHLEADSITGQRMDGLPHILPKAITLTLSLGTLIFTD